MELTFKIWKDKKCYDCTHQVNMVLYARMEIYHCTVNPSKRKQDVHAGVILPPADDET